MRQRSTTYIDTSVWCAYCFNEPESPQACAWLAQAELDKAATALWTHPEFGSAAALNRRAKAHTAASVSKALTAYENAVAMTHQLDVVGDDFLYAQQLCLKSRKGLRAADALHLAVALRHNCQRVASLAKVMNDSALELGLQTLDFSKPFHE